MTSEKEKIRKIDEIPSEFGDKEIEYAYDKLVKKLVEQKK